MNTEEIITQLEDIKNAYAAAIAQMQGGVDVTCSTEQLVRFERNIQALRYAVRDLRKTKKTTLSWLDDSPGSSCMGPPQGEPKSPQSKRNPFYAE